ncbi:MAG: hypothetical protein LBB55_02910 [Zoogloeaceae bacterium]|nr:hypothetical protein [Zoogloeaceae bacterium]
MKGWKEGDTMAEWTQDEAIAYEVAREDILHYMSILTEDIHAEKSKAMPDETRIKVLHEEQSCLQDKLRILSVHDHEEIARVRKKYGALVRARTAAYEKSRLAA